MAENVNTLYNVKAVTNAYGEMVAIENLNGSKSYLLDPHQSSGPLAALSALLPASFAALAGFIPATFDTRFSPKLPLTGTIAGEAFVFTWNANGTINTSIVNGNLKTAVYDTDGTLLSFS